MDSGKIRLMTQVPLVIQCGHCAEAELVWSGNPAVMPDLFFKGLPSGGRMILSKATIMLACRGCASDLDAIIQEAGKTIVLE